MYKRSLELLLTYLIVFIRRCWQPAQLSWRRLFSVHGFKRSKSTCWWRPWRCGRKLVSGPWVILGLYVYIYFTDNCDYFQIIVIICRIYRISVSYRNDFDVFLMHLICLIFIILHKQWSFQCAEPILLLTAVFNNQLQLIANRSRVKQLI